MGGRKESFPSDTYVKKYLMTEATGGWVAGEGKLDHHFFPELSVVTSIREGGNPGGQGAV